MLSIVNDLVYFPNRISEIFAVTLLRGNDFFPVVLIYIYRVQLIAYFVPPYGVHISVQSFSGGKTVALKRIAFPFCKRMHYFGCTAGFFDVKSHGPFCAVKVIVKPCLRQNEKRGGNAGKIELCRQSAFKMILQCFYGKLCFL